MFTVLKRYNTQLTLVSVVLTVVLEETFHGLFESVKFLGDLFINLLKVFALPLICSALIASMGDLGNNLSQLKSIARNAVGYMLFSELMAVTIALVLFNTYKPGVGLDPDLILQGKAFVPSH